MWVLDCDGSSLDKKRVWLRPGKTYLFGRTKENNPRNRFQIENKSISRHHLTLSVSTVGAGDGSNVAKKSTLSLKDEGSKFGTEVDGARVKGDTKVLSGNHHAFRLGNSDQTFHIRWQPVVFTFSLASKESKASKDPLGAFRSRLEHLDIKVVEPYIPGTVTHVVAGKRNTAKGLSALVNGRYIVSERFIDAVVEITSGTDLTFEEAPSRLEEDFDGHWPNALDFLPARSKETTTGPPEQFLPDAARATVFEGYIFVFCDPAQFELLQAPITQGGGKAVHCAVSPGNSTSEEVVRYVKTVAGEKGLGEFEDGSAGKGVVVVKFRGKGKHEEWAARLDYEIAQALDHRLIEQSEFLDAILANDASTLRRPLLPEEVDARQTQSRRQERDAAAVEQPASPTTTLRRKRGPVVSRFKGFDDDDEDLFSLAGPSVPNAQSKGPANTAQAAATELSFSDEESMRVDPAHALVGQAQSDTSKKRPLSDVEEDEDVMDQILPQHTERKRRKLANQDQSQQNDNSTQQSKATPKTAKQVKKRPPAKKVDVHEVMRERREAEEEAAKQDEENLQEIMAGMTVEQMKNLAVVEEMPLPQRRPSAAQSNSSENPRWDDRWNGRKNFKKFHPKGETAQQRRGHSVIVALEEVKQRTFGIGDEYWLEKESEGDKRRRREKERRNKTQSQSQSQMQETAHRLTNSDDHEHVAEIPPELITQDNTHVSETIDLDAPRTTRRQERKQQNSTPTQGENDSSSLLRPLESQPLAEKRGATNQLPNLRGNRKRKKFAAAEANSDHESEGEEGVAPFRAAKRVR